MKLDALQSDNLTANTKLTQILSDLSLLIANKKYNKRDITKYSERIKALVDHPQDDTKSS